MKKFLFVCTSNSLRSPTIAELFKGNLEVEAKSAGTDKKTSTLYGSGEGFVTQDLINWADTVYVMCMDHELWLSRNLDLFRKDVRVLHIPDIYNYQDPRLCNIAKEIFHEFL